MDVVRTPSTPESSTFSTGWGEPARARVGPRRRRAAGRLPARRARHGARFRRLGRSAARRARFRVLAPDLRGHGRSTWEPPWTLARHVADLEETLAAAGLERVAVRGPQLRRPADARADGPRGCVERSVLLDPAVWVPPPIALRRAEEARAATGRSRTPTRRSTRAARPRSSRPREMLEEEVARASRRDRRRQLALALLAERRGRRVRGAVPAASVLGARPGPTLLVVGAETDVVPPGRRRRAPVRARRPLEVVTVPGGHIPSGTRTTRPRTRSIAFLARGSCARGRSDELDRESSRLVLAVEDRVHLDDVERGGSPDSATSSIARCASRYESPPRTGVPTPGATSGSTTSRSRLTWTKPGPGDVRERIAHGPLDAEPVDVAHREHLDAQLAHPLALALVERAHADERHAVRLDRRERPCGALELRPGEAEHGGQHHPVHVAGRRRRRACSGRRARRSRARPPGPYARGQPAERRRARPSGRRRARAAAPRCAARRTSAATRSHVRRIGSR